MMQMSDFRKIGIGLTAFGVVCSFLGVLMFFDKGLLSIGNILFLVGLAMTIGIPATMRFFLRKRNQKGSAFFLFGAACVLYGWAVVGVLVELYGFWLLFSGFFPTVLQFLRKLPGFSRVLDLPVIKVVINRVAPAQTLPI